MSSTTKIILKKYILTRDLLWWIFQDVTSRNCKNYLEEKKKKKGSETSTSGINVIEINIALSSSESWVFDTGSMIHTCKSCRV